MILRSRKKVKIKNFIYDITGNSVPLVMLIALVVLIIGGAVAYATVQVFSTVRGETHSLMTYFSAETALERSMCSLDSHITKDTYAASKDITFTGDITDYINKIIDSLNDESSGILSSTEVGVYANESMNKAIVDIRYSWPGGNNYRMDGLYKIIVPITISATAKMENGLFRSYGKETTATREFEIWLPRRFELRGAVYTLGDLLATTKDDGYAPEEALIKGNIYVFGTGLDKANRMQQHYNGGLCADRNAKLKIIEGNIYTRNLLRAGTFDESESSTESCAIIVENDVVAQGIQVFGHKDSIVVFGDAYTFDDVELNGADSYIVINGNYYGLNQGDDTRHDTSSAIINTAPAYAQGLISNYMKSRIVINGDVFVNGTTFRLEDPNEGEVGHKLEDASLGWINVGSVVAPDYKQTYLALGIDAGAETGFYREAIRDRKDDINGFSVLLQTGLGKNYNINYWNEMINHIRSRADYYKNDLSNISEVSIPRSISGFCNFAFDANDRIYIADENPGDPTEEPQIVMPDSFSTFDNISKDINGMSDFFDNYIDDWEDWGSYSSAVSGMPAALNHMMNLLLDYVEVFATKEYPGDNSSDEIKYSFVQGTGIKTQFEELSEYLKGINPEQHPCVLKYEEGIGSEIVIDIFDELNENFSEQYAAGKYFLVLNFDPNKELRIKDEMNGLIFSIGKVVLERSGKVNGSVIAAGKGYDPIHKVMDSAAGYYEYNGVTVTRLPRVVLEEERDEDGNVIAYENINEFKNWSYAALVFENGGSIDFPGREALFEAIRNSTGIDLYTIF
ncbi:MAG: hypothetical protein GX045_06210 [Clostridiaceae bacterium]|nr:hypothetical protein [Clostridiaceae bacterium]